MRGWQVVTGAGDNWSPGAPSDAAIHSLLPRPAASAANTLWPPVISSGGVDREQSGSQQHQPASRVDRSGSLALTPWPSMLSPFPSASLPKPIQEMQAAQAAEQVADGHSSGHSGGGHLDATTLQGAVKKEGPSPLDSEPAASSYRLRTRSSSLRAAWVERPLTEEEEEEEEEGKALGDGLSDGLADLSSDSEDEAPRAQSRKGSRPGKATGKAGKAAPSKAAAKAAAAAAAAEEDAEDAADAAAQKRLGRPVAYSGDPDAPELTEAERRKIKRRIANRESARRVRAKRAELMDELQIKVTALNQQNAQLANHAAVMENQRNMLVQQNALLQQKLSQKSEENVVIFNQLFHLRRVLPPEVVAQAEREAAAATPPPSSPMPMQASGMFVPVSPHAPHPGPMHGATGSRGLAEDAFNSDTHGMPQGLQFL